MQPVGFDVELSQQWSLWVLEHGLPEIPGRLAVDESVPVACWVGPTTAAVLHVRRVLDEDEEAPYLDTDLELFVLANSTWEDSGGGGANWPGSLPSWEDDGSLTRIEGPPDHVDLGGIVGSDSETGGCKALWGEVGTAAASAEVSQGGQVTRRRVEAPLGAFVVCGVAAQPLTVRILDAGGHLLTQIEEPAGFERPPWLA